MADQIYSLVWTFNNAGQFSQNVTHWRFDDAGFNSTHSAALALATAMNASRKAIMIGILPVSTTLLSFKARRVTSTGGFEAVLPVTAGGVGTRPGNASASGIAPCSIGYPTLPIDRKRARIFLCGVSDTDLVGGQFTVAYKAAVVGAFATLFDPIALTGGGNPTATFVLKAANAAFATPIVTWLLSDAPGQLRRRQLPA